MDDDEIVAKNTSVVIKRVPAKNAASSLISRINNMNNFTHRNAHPSQATADT